MHSSATRCTSYDALPPQRLVSQASDISKSLLPRHRLAAPRRHNRQYAFAFPRPSPGPSICLAHHINCPPPPDSSHTTPNIQHQQSPKRNSKPSNARMPPRTKSAPRTLARHRGPSRDERRLRTSRHYEAQEAQLGRTKSGQSEVIERDRHHGVYPRRRTQCAATQCCHGAWW